jgi:hypothetical protein
VAGEPAAALLSGSTSATERATGSTDATSITRAAVVAERLRRAGARLGSDDAPPVAEDTAQKATDTDATTLFSTVTDLRLPSRLELTPRGGATVFTHAGPPVTRDGRTELWHTRLATLRQDGRAMEVPSHLIALESTS